MSAPVVVRVVVIGAGFGGLGVALTVFQRSAPYVVPKPDRASTPAHHRLVERRARR